MLPIMGIYAAVGAVAGVLAGLLGIGGGLVIVPMLVYTFSMQGFEGGLIMKLALGTSMGSIVFTAISSFMAHHRRGAVDWGTVKMITPGVLVGPYLGSLLAAFLPGAYLRTFFAVFLYLVATQMLLGRQPKATRQLPGRMAMAGAGGVIGIVSSLAGIGGGVLSVPFLVWHNVQAHRAIGTSAAIGFPIAIGGTFGYIVNGIHASGLPHLALGYIYLPALGGIVAASVLTAPLGVKLAHHLPVIKLKRIFAVLLYIVATRMLIGVIGR